MVAFKWCCKRTRIVGFQCILLLLYCLLRSMQRLLSCSAWLFLLADAGQATKLFQYQAMAEHKSSICSFIYNMQPHQPPCTYSDNARTAQAEQDSLLKVFWKTETHAAANFPKCDFISACTCRPFPCTSPALTGFPLRTFQLPAGEGGGCGRFGKSPGPQYGTLARGLLSVLCPKTQLTPRLWKCGVWPAWGGCGGCGVSPRPQGTALPPGSTTAHTPCDGVGLLTAQTGPTNHPSY